MKQLIIFLISLAWFIPTLADDYNPNNPPDPNTKYRVVTSATPAGNASGSGTYMAGENVTIRTSASSTDYTFSHWTKDGEYYSDETSFNYTVEPKKTTFVAVYNFTPKDPGDPQANYGYRLHLESDIAGACSFNRTSGEKVEGGSNVTVRAYVNQNYDFLGWYCGEVMLSESESFTYTMPNASVTLEAKFEFNPKDPADPDVDVEKNYVLGDANGDRQVTVSDITMMIQSIFNQSVSNFNKTAADVNKDNYITVSDITYIITNIIFKR